MSDLENQATRRARKADYSVQIRRRLYGVSSSTRCSAQESLASSGPTGATGSKPMKRRADAAP